MRRSTIQPDRGVSAPRSSRARGSRGATLIEFALVLPVMLLLAWGLIELGFAYKTSSTLTGATRSGARAASATYAQATRSSNPGQLTATLDNIRTSVERDLVGLPPQATPSTLWIYRADANGNPASGATCASSCLRYRWDATTKRFAADGGTWPSPAACGMSIDWVAVRVTARHDMTTPLVSDLTVTRNTTMRLEPISDGTC